MKSRMKSFILVLALLLMMLLPLTATAQTPAPDDGVTINVGSEPATAADDNVSISLPDYAIIGIMVLAALLIVVLFVAVYFLSKSNSPDSIYQLSGVVTDILSSVFDKLKPLIDASPNKIDDRLYQASQATLNIYHQLLTSGTPLDNSQAIAKWLLQNRAKIDLDKLLAELQQAREVLRYQQKE